MDQFCHRNRSPLGRRSHDEPDGGRLEEGVRRSSDDHHLHLGLHRQRPDESTTPDPFVQPTGAADAYSVGDRVTFEGAVWESVMDANVWSPTAYPAGWKKAG